MSATPDGGSSQVASYLTAESLPAAFDSFCALVPTEDRFQVALDELLPALEAEDGAIYTKLSVAYILVSLYREHTFSVNPFASQITEALSSLSVAAGIVGQTAQELSLGVLNSSDGSAQRFPSSTANESSAQLQEVSQTAIEATRLVRLAALQPLDLRERQKLLKAAPDAWTVDRRLDVLLLQSISGFVEHNSRTLVDLVPLVLRSQPYGDASLCASRISAIICVLPSPTTAIYEIWLSLLAAANDELYARTLDLLEGRLSSLAAVQSDPAEGEALQAANALSMFCLRIVKLRIIELPEQIEQDLLAFSLKWAGASQVARELYAELRQRVIEPG